MSTAVLTTLLRLSADAARPSAPSCSRGSSDAPLSPDDIPLWPYVFAKSLICLYCGICLLSLLSILRIVCHHHRLSSFRFFFLSLSLLWTLLRVAFFLSSPSSSAPCEPTSTLSDSSSPPPFPLYHFVIDLVYYLPASCQLAMFSLLLLFYAKLYHQQAHTWKQVERRCTALFAALNLSMLLLTLAFIVVIQRPAMQQTVEWLHQGYFILSALFFLTLFLIACNYLSLLYRHTHASLLLSSHHLSLSSVIFLLLLSRCVFDAGAALDSSALLFRRQLFETNAGVLIDLSTFLLLVMWEIVPTFLVIAFFRDSPPQPPSASSAHAAAAASPLSLSALCPAVCRSCLSRLCPSVFSSHTAFSSFRPAGHSFASSEALLSLAEEEDAEDAEAFYYDSVGDEDEEEAERRRQREQEERREEQERYANLSVFSPFSSSLLLSMSASPSHPFHTQYMAVATGEGKGGTEGGAAALSEEGADGSHSTEAAVMQQQQQQQQRQHGRQRTGNGFDSH